MERVRAEKPLEDAVLAKRFEILANAAVFAKSEVVLAAARR